jgi:hypothetical protein
MTELTGEISSPSLGQFLSEHGLWNIIASPLMTVFCQCLTTWVQNRTLSITTHKLTTQGRRFQMRSHIHNPFHYQSNVLFNCSIRCQLQVKNPLVVSLNFLLCCQNNKFLVLHPTGDVHKCRGGNCTNLYQALDWGRHPRGQRATPEPSLESLTEGSYDLSNPCGCSRQHFKHNNGHKLLD